jgi:hypothetical protein
MPGRNVPLAPAFDARDNRIATQSTRAQRRRGSPAPWTEAVGGEALRPGLVTCSLADPGWMDVVRRHPGATAFHHPAWSRVITDTYGFDGFVLTRRALNGSILAGLPVIRVDHPLLKPRLASLPFTDHCPPLIAEGEDSIQFLNAVETWRDARGEGLEIRAGLPEHAPAGSKVVGTRRLVVLDPDPATVFRTLHRNRVQKRVRRAPELGVQIVITRSRGDLEIFYRLHCQTRRRQGVPVHPRRFIQSIWTHLVEPGLGFAVLAFSGSTPIAAALFLAWNGHLTYKFGASDSSHWRLGANFLVHWTAIEWGCVNGFRTYDFGRTDSAHESLREFKSAWGGAELPLVYSYMGSAAPRSKSGLAASTVSKVIKHSPTAVCRALGELLYRYTA